MPHCTVPLCTNHSRKTVGTGISYHKLPTGPLKNIWLRNIRRENIRANVHTRVCSEHFTEDSFEPAIEIIPGFKKSKKLKSTAVPTVFAFHTRANEDKTRPSSLKQIQSRARKVCISMQQFYIYTKAKRSNNISFTYYKNHGIIRLFTICLHIIQIIITLQYSFCLWLTKLASELFDWITFSRLCQQK